MKFSSAFKASLLAVIVCVVAVRLHGHADVLSTKLVLGALAIQPFMLISLYATALRFSALVRHPPLHPWPAFKAVTLSSGLNVLLPARLSELLKATYIRDCAGIPLAAGIGAIVLERVFDLCALIVFAAAGTGLVFKHGLPLSALYMAVTAALAILTLMNWERVGSIVIPLLPWPVLRTFVERLHIHVAARLERAVIARCTMYTLLNWLASWLGVLAFMYASGNADLGASGAMAVFLGATLGAVIPLAPAGLGTFEAGVVVAMQKYGYGFDESLALALVLHIATMGPNLLGAFIIATLEKTGISAIMREIRNLGDSNK